jgi:hypothetical protein
LGAYLLALGMASAGTRARVEAERALLDAHAAFSASPDEREREAGTRPCARELAALYDAWHLAEPGAGHDEQALVWRERSLDGELK